MQFPGRIGRSRGLLFRGVLMLASLRGLGDLRGRRLRSFKRSGRAGRGAAPLFGWCPCCCVPTTGVCQKLAGESFETIFRRHINAPPSFQWTWQAAHPVPKHHVTVLPWAVSVPWKTPCPRRCDCCGCAGSAPSQGLLCGLGVTVAFAELSGPKPRPCAAR